MVQLLGTTIGQYLAKLKMLIFSNPTSLFLGILSARKQGDFKNYTKRFATVFIIAKSGPNCPYA